MRAVTSIGGCRVVLSLSTYLRVGHVARRLVHTLRVPVYVHKLRVRVELQQQLDARRVHGRLEEQPLAAAAQRELLEEVQKVVDPALCVVRRRALERKVLAEVGLVRHEDERHVGRDARRHDVDGELCDKAAKKEREREREAGSA